MTDIPLPGTGRVAVAVPAPAARPRAWAGAPSAALDDGSFVLAHRVRVTDQDVAETAIARSPDGERFVTVATLGQGALPRPSKERPALVRTVDGGWRPYVSCASPDWPRASTGGSRRSTPATLRAWPRPRPSRCSPATASPRSRTR